MSGNDISASSVDTPISATGNNSNNHQNDETHQQRQSVIPERGSGERRSMSPVQGVNSMLGSFPAAVATQAVCSKMVDDFRSSKISKGTTLSRIHTTLVDALPEDLSAVEDSFTRYLSIVEDHECHLAQAKQCGNKRSVDNGEHQDDGDEGEPESESPISTKRTKPNDSQYPWIVSDFIRNITLSPSLTATLDLLKLYAIDLKDMKRSLVNSPSCPEFPDSEWTNILAGRAVNLDAVLSGYYSTSNNDERVESIGEVEIKFGTVALTKVVSSAGEWTISWNRTSCATSTAFPHRAGELADYVEYMVRLFAATDIHFHDRVILFDKAVRRRIGSHRDLELTDFNKFADLKAAHMDSTGAAVVQRASLATKSQSSRKKQEACNQWNDNLCLLDSSQCRRLHVCNKCSKGRHKGPDCPSLQ